MIVAAALAVTLLGNLRLQASEIGTPTLLAARPAYVGEERGADIEYRPVAASARGRVSIDHSAATPLASMIDVDDGSVNDDDAHLIPAIYAWDPDVRFVFFRHVSKWM